ncbi:MAG: hypothetical protein ABEJ89_06380 [Haloarculaceae archaeon]
MSATGRDAAHADAASDAAALERASFVRLVGRADGDALAATGLLARALDARDTPFQASIVTPTADADRVTDADCTVAVGRADASADLSIRERPVAAVAHAVARELDAGPDPTLALAGAIASGESPGDLLEAVERSGAERRPGVAVPIADLADGLAHSTLFHAPFSGDPDAAADALAGLESADPDADDRRRVASLVALAVAGDDEATSRAADAVERALRPHAGGPLETVEGYADVLDAVARERPGVGVALALGSESAVDPALSAWRAHARGAHRGVREATTGRYDGLFVARGTHLPVGTVARLLADYRSPEPVTLAVTDGVAAVRATDGRDVSGPTERAAAAVDGRASGRGPRARARFETDTASFIEALREAL